MINAKLKTLITFLIIFLVMASPVMAVTLKNPLDPTNANIEGEAIYGRVIGAVLAFAGAGALISFILAGVFFLFSGGNPERVKKARDIMVYAALGMLILFGAYAITNFILTTLTGNFGL
jgi:hypothetical protein